MPLLSPVRIRKVADFLIPTKEEKAIIDCRRPGSQGWLGEEHLLQRTILREVHLRFPSIAHRLHAIPNGGGRSKAQAGKLKAEGVRPGVPDLHLPIPTPSSVGLYIELKKARACPSPDQWDWLTHLHRHGYTARVINHPDDAIRTISNYLLHHLPK